MTGPSIASVREKIEVYRRTRKNRREAFPSDIVHDLGILLRSNKKSHLIRELGVPESIFNRVPKSDTTSMVRVAPVLISEAASLCVEVSLPGGHAARVLGLSSVSAAAELLCLMTGGKRC